MYLNGRYPILALWPSCSLPTPDKPVTIKSEFHFIHPRYHANVVPVCKWELNSRHRTKGRATIRGPKPDMVCKSPRAK